MSTTNITAVVDPRRLERLGPAERVIRLLTEHCDHMRHNRPGAVVRDPTSEIGVTWFPCSWKLEGEPVQKVVYKLVKVGKGTRKTRLGVIEADGRITDAGRVVAEYRAPGLFPEVVTWMYRLIADVWKTDNEFAAKFASWSFPKEHRDLKVVLAAFMLVQSRRGDPVLDAGVVAFHDDDFRDVGEAMLLLREKGRDFDPKLVLRVAEVLNLPGVATINRELGFGNSARRAFLGRWPRTAEKWLRYREQNARVLEGLVKAGFRTTVMTIARKIGYMPITESFFRTLRWKQAQAKDGRRTLAIGLAVEAAETWAGLDETAVCERIVATKPGWKRLVGLLPPEVGLTRAVAAAAIEAGSLSDADLIILTPTLEELGLLDVPFVRERWQMATRKVENTRAANIASRVKSTVVAEQLQDAADKAVATAMEEVVKDLRIYVVVDKSGSMQNSLEAAKGYLAKMIVGFPLERLHVSVFNTFGSEIVLKAASRVAVDQAFRGHEASGGTDYSAGLRAISHHLPVAGEDVLIIFVGDEGDYGSDRLVTEARKLNPVAFGLLKVPGEDAGVVTRAATALGIPCLKIDTGMFDDPYAVTRTLRHLVATTPVSTGAAGNVPARPVRKTLIEDVLGTPILSKPSWAV